VKSRYDLPQRWYRIKAGLLGLDRLADYDRSCSVASEDRPLGWSDATELVLDAYDSFSPELASICRRFLDEGWIDAPATPPFPAPMVPALPIPALPTPPVAVHAVLVVGGETVGTVGGNGLGPTVPTTGNTPVVGTAGAELTPRLLISIEPNGIPVRATPPGVVGDVDVGVDDEAMLLEPEPHIPDIPDVSSIPEDVDIPAVADIPDDADAPDAAVVSDVAVLPVVAAVAGAALPAAAPPPSKLAVDPNVPDADIPPVEHAVPLVVMAPLVGIAIVPVTLPVGAGLTPAELISVAPIGSPVVPTDPLVPIPSGEVAPSEGTAVSGSSGSST
jgi:hypothetical protein